MRLVLHEMRHHHFALHPWQSMNLVVGGAQGVFDPIC